MIATDDYELLTRDAGLLERPGRAVLQLEGSEAAEFLQGQVTNDVESLEPGTGCYAALLDHKGKLRTDMRVLALAPDRLLVDADPAGRAVLSHTFTTYSLGRDVRIADLTDERTVLSLIGPQARERLDAAPAEAEHSSVEGTHGLYVATDLGVDVIVDAAGLDAARELAPAVSEEAAEGVRIESGRPRLGMDMGSSTIPQEAGLNDRAVSFTKGCYVGQETVARLHYRGKPNRHLRGLELSEPVEHGAPIVLGEKEVGTVGSACVSPRLGPIALALVRREAAPGDSVVVGGVPATVVELPFAGA
ncbi:MAG TPA: glycine cleavage T C-terminal barrel domain-containing protein [Thermoleophilaceae bacterium]|nr:glycine cleavage T C-terminal barrel domain-containing protein [Thermoleophilaceae bacterium]